MSTKDETNTTSARARRYAHVSALGLKAGAGIAASKVRHAARGEKDEAAQARLRRDQAVILRHALGGLKGPLMKVAQILGTIPDLVPPEYAEEFAKLQADAPPMGAGFVTRRLKAELGAEWQDKFQSFDKAPSFAASLGQVHRALSREGEPLACKLQYPDMASVVEADLGQLKLFMALFEKIDRAVDTKDIQGELAARLREELDYTREAKHLKLFGKILEETDFVHVPSLHENLSTGRLLTMGWLDGARIEAEAKEASQERRNKIATNMFHAWYKPFYQHGILHGDPHLGNYTVREDASLNLLDFGCVRIFDAKLVESIILLYRALLEDDSEAAVEAYKAWGFYNPSKELISILNIWARFIYAPLLQEGVHDLKETNTGFYGRETTRKIHAELRKIGGLKVPKVFVFMDRAAIGLGSVFLRLEARVNWFQMFGNLIENFDGERLTQSQQRLKAEVGLGADED